MNHLPICNFQDCPLLAVNGDEYSMCPGHEAAWTRHEEQKHEASVSRLHVFADDCAFCADAEAEEVREAEEKAGWYR